MKKDKSSVLVWERTSEGKRICKHYPTPLYFYIEDEDGEYTSMYNKPLTKIECDSYGQFWGTKEDFKSRRIPVYESDIHPEYKILSENYYKSSGKLNVTYYDLEVDYNPVDGHATQDNPYAPINAASLYHEHTKRAVLFAVPPKDFIVDNEELEKISIETNCKIIICKNEKELLLLLMDELNDTDVISAWNGYGFDDWYLYERLGKVIGQFMANRLSFDGGKIPYYKEVMNKWKIIVNKLILSGRVSLDYMELFIKFQQGNRDSYSLDAISEEELPHLPKLEYEGSLYDLYNKKFYEFIRYNARDTEILKGLEQKFGYVALAIEMARSTSNKLEDVLGTTKMTEMAIVNHCHHILNKMIPDSKEAVDDGKKFKGAFVVPTLPGMYDNVAAIDVTSLYPSTMRSLNISPECIIGQFYDNHVAFEHIKDNNGMMLTVLYENNVSETRSTQEWREYFIECNWAISAYGTIFDQNNYGIISTILTNWFAERKAFKKKMAELKNSLVNYVKDSKEYTLIEEEMKYYDRLQNIKKLSLNSAYGATGNKFFKFFDIRLAESTTRSGQEVIKHMLRKIGEIMYGEYIYPNPAIVAGDTDSVARDSLITVDNIEDTIENIFENLKKEHGVFVEGEKEYIKFSNCHVSPCYLNDEDRVDDLPISTIYRHKTKKRQFKIEVDSGKIIKVTEDHSIIVFRNNKLTVIKPVELTIGDEFLQLC